ncbi:MAG: NAD(P)H-binding protein, partial [Desulfobacteraceae bacterium]
MTGNRSKKTILVVGATGYVGGRLVPLLASRGYKVRAMGRSLDKLNCRPWARHPKVETVEADVLDRQAFARAAMGCSAAFYLVHSMIAAKKGYAGADRQGALNMAAVAAA